MSLYYSSSTGGFYDPALHASLPDDFIPVTRARHAKLMQAQAEGAAIVASAVSGKPIIQRVGQNAETRRASLRASIKRETARRIAEISPIWRQLNDWRLPSPTGSLRFARIDAIREASDAIELLVVEASAAALETFEVRENSLWPEFEGAV